VDIGAAEGYYAVGLARRNPQARVIAFEMESKGRAALKQLAALNGIKIQIAENLNRQDVESADIPLRKSTAPYPKNKDSSVLTIPQVELHGKCEFENLQATLESVERSLVVCDVEGYEEVLLVPEKIPALASATLLVETHEFIRRGITECITKRFTDTHDIECIWQEPRYRSDFPFSSWVTCVLPKSYLNIAVSEWRPERMCWLWMKPKK
jgi:FkbM family methyltransferase